MKIILYGSQYGTAKRYALSLSERTGIEARSHEAAPALDGCETIVYIGALYAGGVLGMKKTLAALPPSDSRKLILVTVGLADPENEENIRNIRRGMRRQLSPALYAQAQILHLRGGIDYGRLTLLHRAMMALLYRKASGLPEEKKTAEVRAMLETYGQRVDLTDLSRLDALIPLL